MNGEAPRTSRGSAYTLSASQRMARRAARRRQIRRRRTVGLGAVATIIALAVVGATSGGRSVLSHTAPRAASPGPRPGDAAAASATKHFVVQSGALASHSPDTPADAQATAVDRVLRYTSYVQLAGHRRREVALTFDDGPGPYTSQVLGVLTKMRVPATFFLIGRSVSAYPHLVAAEVAAGEEVGDHTETHPPLGELSPAEQTAQVTEAASAITRAGAPAPVLLRPPYGSLDGATVQVLRAQRMLMVLWSVDTNDYTRPGVSRIVYSAVSGAQPGAIILMHDGGGDRSETVAALPRIITQLRQRGFRLVTISQLITDDPPPRNQPPPHSLAGF